LAGPSQIGKTAVLQQLHNGRLGPDSVPIYVDLAQLAQHTASIFFWELAQTALADFKQKRRLSTQLAQSDFVASPQRALTDQFLQPVMARLDGRRLLLLLDNVQTLEMNGDDETLAKLFSWLRRQTAVTGILTLTQENANLTPNWIGILAGAERFFMEPLQLDEVTDYLQQTQPVLLAKAVIQQIYENSGGQPTAVQDICRFLQTRLTTGRLRQITLADLAMAHKMGVGRF
ncbi:MAG: AAA family ATPase, partial [Anaerolineae bacterium]